MRPAQISRMSDCIHAAPGLDEDQATGLQSVYFMHTARSQLLGTQGVAAGLAVQAAAARHAAQPPLPVLEQPAAAPPHAAIALRR